jgi:hypothetical protein
VELVGGEDVVRGMDSRMRLRLKCGGILPPEAWSITVKSQNLFTGKPAAKQKVIIGSEKDTESMFSTDTSELGRIRCHIARAWILDYLGLIPIPVKKGGAVSITVLPDKEKPFPEPELVEKSARAVRPKPQGFSEEHELRPYREGDPINLIHWKLSSKHDEYIVREPQEIIRRSVALVIAPPPRYEDHRSVLEQLCYLNDVLAENKIKYTLQYGKTPVAVASANDFDDFIKGVLSEPMRAEQALSPEVEGDAAIYRIEPRRGGAS